VERLVDIGYPTAIKEYKYDPSFPVRFVLYFSSASWCDVMAQKCCKSLLQRVALESTQWFSRRHSRNLEVGDRPVFSPLPRKVASPLGRCQEVSHRIILNDIAKVLRFRSSGDYSFSMTMSA